MRFPATQARSKRYGIGIWMLVCTMLFATAAGGREYVDLRRIGLITNADATAGESKSSTCVACHGKDGVSPAPTFPHLRGMTVEYLYMQLRDFKNGQGPQRIMQPIVETMSDQDLHDTAAYYARVGNEPLKSMPAATSRPAEQIREGERLYFTGDVSRGIPPCQGCHGEQALGHPAARTTGSPAAYRLYPSLRGQQFDYLVTKLKEYRDRKHTRSSSDLIMTGAAYRLDDEAIEAVAAWASTQSLP